jgi:hypothetical protein
MKKEIIILGLVALLVVSIVSITAFALVNENMGTLRKYENMSEEQLLSRLKGLNKSEMTAEMKNIFAELSGADINVLIPFASELRNRINEYSEDELISLITNKDNDLFFRITIVQLYSSMKYEKRTSKGNDSIRDLLLDEKAENDLKENIIIGLDFSDEKGLKILDSIAHGENDLLAFQAIKKLNKIDSVKAVEISNKILKNYKNETPEKVNAALKVMAQEYRNNRIQKNLTAELQQKKMEFIEICVGIINASKKDDKLQDCAVFALSDMTDSDAITAIIKNNNMDESLKVYAVDQNYNTLLEMANSTNSDQEIDVICDAVKIYPLKGLKNSLSEIKSKVSSNQLSGLKNGELVTQTITKIDTAIALIEKEGADSNPKWNDFYNGVK